MGYACPVCSTEEADGVHLANHFAVTASLGRENHLEWLERHAPDWNERSPEQLAEIVTEHAREVETPEFEQGTGRSPSLEAELAAQSRGPGRGSMTQDPSPEAQGALEEARELTQQLYESTESTDGEAMDETTTDETEATGKSAEESSTESDNETL
ncbi:hypothetical protein HALLA_18490 [Halostagnicola larsenii XH-48]|uniref:Uncharacterized protein n=1 Tax=Halostagnicola larsenii XH-48 TaxID=797299 RepID=W0JTC2_9EURY|nr:DUF5810 domain-containing protein [Halostagnicola larsenii]AHG00490.1 hypothetical protein HALLA_18490 [Halostagnicola larsenii XH-48]